jgi:hypothetical protein
MFAQLAHQLPLFVAEVLVRLATDTAGYLSRWGEALKVNTVPRFRFCMAPWAPRAPSVSGVGGGCREMFPQLAHQLPVPGWGGAVLFSTSSQKIVQYPRKAGADKYSAAASRPRC